MTSSFQPSSTFPTTVPPAYTLPTAPSLCDTLTKPINQGEKKSFVYSCVISALFTLDPVVGLISGLVSALASRIDSCVSPILKQHLETTLDDVFGDASPFVKFSLKLVVVLTIINAASLVLAPLFGVAIEIDILFATIISLAINLPNLLSETSRVLDTAPEGRPYYLLFV